MMREKDDIVVPCILVVDDDKLFCQVLTETLQEEGYQVIGAVNAAKVLEVLEQLVPDVILLDLHMPDIDGPTFIRQYREREGSRVPIILISADDNLKQIAADVAADSYLAKPFETEQLRTLLSFYTRL